MTTCIICGSGETGQVVISELLLLGRKFVVVELDEERVAALMERGDVLAVRGDATDDAVLKKVKIERACGIIAALRSDTENLFLVLSARQLNPSTKIIARSVDPATDSKLRRAGADFVVAANTIVANRMVSAIVRPHVVTFIDELLRDPTARHRIEEVVIRTGSDLDGTTLEESHIGSRTGSLVLALQPEDGASFHCNPSAQERLEAGMKLVVLGEVDHFGELQRMAGAS